MPSVKWFVATFGTILASAGLAIGNKFNQTPLGLVWLAGCVALLGWYNWPGRYNRKTLEGTLGLLCKLIDGCDSADVRCCLWVPCPVAKGEVKKLRQVTCYQPDGGGRDRLMDVHKGITGRAYRDKTTIVEMLSDPKYEKSKGFRGHMMKEWHFSKAEAAHLTQDRRSYLAVPIRKEDGTVIGVLYCDSDEPETFADPKRVEWIEGWAPFFGELLLQRGA